MKTPTETPDATFPNLENITGIGASIVRPVSVVKYQRNGRSIYAARQGGGPIALGPTAPYAVANLADGEVMNDADAIVAIKRAILT